MICQCKFPQCQHVYLILQVDELQQHQQEAGGSAERGSASASKKRKTALTKSLRWGQRTIMFGPPLAHADSKAFSHSTRLPLTVSIGENVIIFKWVRKALVA
jgi:hypothetical protein